MHCKTHEAAALAIRLQRRKPKRQRVNTRFLWHNMFCKQLENCAVQPCPCAAGTSKTLLNSNLLKSVFHSFFSHFGFTFRCVRHLIGFQQYYPMIGMSECQTSFREPAQ